MAVFSSRQARGVVHNKTDGSVQPNLYEHVGGRKQRWLILRNVPKATLFRLLTEC
jgi:hypothetical protein